MWSLSVCYRNLPYRSLQRTNLVKHPSNNNNNDVLSKLWYRQITNQPTAFVQQHLSSPISIASRSYFNPWLRNSNHNHRLRNDQNRPLQQQQQQQQQTCNPIINTTIRYKHSQTQIKRLFKGHPARLRVEKRLWNIDRKQPRVIVPTNFDIIPSKVVSTSFNETIVATQPTTINTINPVPTDIDEQSVSMQQVSLPTLLYPPIYTPTQILPNGWFEPMDPKTRPVYPFHIIRTKNKPKDAIGFLPIYTKYRYVTNNKQI
jgi:hypothetical protein